MTVREGKQKHNSDMDEQVHFFDIVTESYC